MKGKENDQIMEKYYKFDFDNMDKIKLKLFSVPSKNIY